MTEVRMPKPGDAIAEAELLEFYVTDGDQVAEGEPLYNLATDKVEMDVEAPAAGVVHWQVEVGGTYVVGALLAVIE